ncbi:MAG: 23S rRNA (adenine(2030)-N(6))-methyltransferase RlmJ [Alphaproteobacteria bacterium]|nr:23S rRNA (adenine(2030)-N(6))-methyltransferase RlmJ [Alphaproteobacteria bacterium]
MLSYQHAYHAGSLADVHKHAVLVHVLQYLTERFPRITFMDTHSGRGMYRINSVEAQKTGEAASGIVRLMEQKKLADQPLGVVLRQIRGRYGEDSYPGSPFIAENLLRSDDRMHLFELHPAEVRALEKNLQARNIRIQHYDGYDGSSKLCPPVPQNGLVLIDPSFEVKSEYMLAAEYVEYMAEHWPQAVQLLWYPMLKANNHVPMIEALEQMGLPQLWHQQIQFCDPESVRGLYGSGLIAVNMPDALYKKLETVRDVFA